MKKPVQWVRQGLFWIGTLAVITGLRLYFSH